MYLNLEDEISQLDREICALSDIVFSQCTLCGRCAGHCSLGMDTPFIVRAVRAMAGVAGTAPKTLIKLTEAEIQKGENQASYKPGFLERISDLEQQLRALTNDPTATIPVEKRGAKILFVPTTETTSILHSAIIFNATGEDWTLSIFEAANHGLFLGDENRARQIAKRIVDEANRLNVKEIVLAECGPAYKSYRWDVPKWFAGQFDFKIRSLVEVIAEYIGEGRIKVDPTIISESVTYHDPCNLVSKSDILEEPRYILSKITADFREMTPNKTESLCCGGGGGLVELDEYSERRLAAGRPKANQIKETGAQIVVTACNACRLQIGHLSEYYDLNVQVATLADLVVRAMRLPQTLP